MRIEQSFDLAEYGFPRHVCRCRCDIVRVIMIVLLDWIGLPKEINRWSIIMMLLPSDYKTQQFKVTHRTLSDKSKDVNLEIESIKQDLLENQVKTIWWQFFLKNTWIYMNLNSSFKCLCVNVSKCFIPISVLVSYDHLREHKKNFFVQNYFCKVTFTERKNR